MKRILIIDEKAKEDIRTLIARAEKFMITKDKLKRMVDGSLPPVGDYDEFTIYLKKGFRIVYSHEQHPIGTLAHLSVSVDDGEAPSQEAVDTIMQLFNMGRLLNAFNICLEPVDEDRFAVNVLTELKLQKYFEKLN